MEELDNERLIALLNAFCRKNRLSRGEELFIGEQLKQYGAAVSTSVDTTGNAYEPLVDEILGLVPRGQRGDAFKGTRFNELFHRTRYQGEIDGVKRWYMPEFFDYIYEYIALKEERVGINSRFHYLYNVPSTLLDCYSLEEVEAILERKEEASELFKLLQLKVEKDARTKGENAPAKSPELPIDTTEEIQLYQGRLRRSYLLIVLLGASCLAFAGLYFLSNRIPENYGMAPINYEALQGDSIGQFSLVFRSKDTLDKLWTFPELTFYRLKHQPNDDNGYLVKMKGLYRSSGTAWQTDSINHVGFAKVYGPFIQLELEPEKDRDLKLYGKWFATIFVGDSRTEAMFKPGFVTYGVGGGISNYKTKEERIENISSYVLRMHHSSPNNLIDSITLNEMIKKVEIITDSIAAQPDSVKFQLLRTMFNGN
ncbi:hypothetical protein [Lewinella sp. LCG006]|uniref:hypothetical protein n=1 Tax=Lewinella sp. LCG006 TaxID=3231911 RepID=UPI00346049EA